MLFIVGLGLGDEKDITLNGLEAVKKCGKVYLEMYTSILGVPKERLEELYGREVTVADRQFVEQGIDGMLKEALNDDVAFLVRFNTTDRRTTDSERRKFLFSSTRVR